MFSNWIRGLSLAQFWGGLGIVIKKLDKIMASQIQLAADLRGVKATLDKIGTETTTLLEKIAALEEQLKNQDVSPELQAAFDDVKAAAQAVDGEVPDAPSGGEATPAPDLENVNTSAQTNEEKMHGAGPGTLPDLQKQFADSTGTERPAPDTGGPEGSEGPLTDTAPAPQE